MKIIDPQSATLTTQEIHAFLSLHPPRPNLNPNPQPQLHHPSSSTTQRPTSAHPATNLTNCALIHDDLRSYIATCTPFIPLQPPPDTWLAGLLTKLKPYSLTKSEVLMLINLGVGVSRPRNIEPMEDEMETDDMQLLGTVIESTDERFSEEQQLAILGILREGVPTRVPESIEGNEGMITEMEGFLPNQPQNEREMSVGLGKGHGHEQEDDKEEQQQDEEDEDEQQEDEPGREGDLLDETGRVDSEGSAED